jgi:hypothetical protein
MQKKKAKKVKVRVVTRKKSSGKPKAARKKKASKPKKSNFFGGLGHLVGSAFGGAPGAMLGQAAGDLFGKLTGLGAYKLNRNSLMTDSNGPPSFGNIGQGHLISHREFLNDVSGTVGFALTSYPIQPGLAATFPWLASIAALYEEWQLVGCVFEYRPTCGTAVSSTNNAMGTVIMATNYDSTLPVFTNKQQMEAYEFTTSCVPYNAMLHPVECQPALNPLGRLYIRTNTAPLVKGDQRLYDLGLFQIATVGMQASVVIGELWVSYEVKLLKPRLPTPLGGNIPFMHIEETPSATGTVTAPFGTTGGKLTTGSTLTSTLVNSNTFQLNSVGTYLIAFLEQGGGVNTTSIGVAYGANITGLNAIDDNTTFTEGTFSPNVAVTVSTVNVNTAGFSGANNVTVTGPTGGTGTSWDVFVVQIPSSAPGFVTMGEIGFLELINKRLEQVESVMNQRGELRPAQLDDRKSDVEWDAVSEAQGAEVLRRLSRPSSLARR